MLDRRFRPAPRPVATPLLALFALAACGDDGGGPAGDVDGGADDAAAPIVDTDRDGLPDDVERAGCSFPTAFDTDGDGLSDGEDVALGLDPCEADSDGDGVDDLGELAHHRVECPDTAPAPGALCDAPAGFTYERLDVGRPDRNVRLTRDTAVRALDVFLLLDLGLGGDPDLATAPLEAWPELAEAFPSVHVGVGAYQDFPFRSYGDPELGDTILEIGSTVRGLDDRAAVEAAAGALPVRSGGDPAGAATEALYRLVTGEEERFTRGEDGPWTWSPPACPGGGTGAACFRPEALPVVVAFPVSCTHEGPPGASSTFCGDYVGVEPEPTRWDQMIRALRERGVVPVGALAPGARGCDPAEPSATLAPCRFLDRLARETGAAFDDGSASVYEVPDDPAQAGAAFVAAVGRAVRESRFDAGATVSAVGPDDVGLELLVGALRPDCAALGPDVPPDRACWEPPAGVDVGDAIVAVEPDAFLGVRTGTKLDWELVLTAPRRGEPTARVTALEVGFARGDAVAERLRIVVAVAGSQPF